MNELTKPIYFVGQTAALWMIFKDSDGFPALPVDMTLTVAHDGLDVLTLDETQVEFFEDTGMVRYLFFIDGLAGSGRYVWRMTGTGGDAVANAKEDWFYVRQPTV